MQIKVSPQVEAISALILKLGYKGDVSQLLNNLAYAKIREELGDVLEAEGLAFKDVLEDQEEAALAELREVLSTNIWFFKNLKFLNGGLRF